MGMNHGLLIVAIAIGLYGIWVMGTTTLSRTSRAAAYVTLADLIDGSGPSFKDVCFMLAVLLIHGVGGVLFVLLCAGLLLVVIRW